MGIVVIVAIAVAVLLAIAAVAILVRRGGRSAASPSPAPTADTAVSKAPRAEPAPMTGLEDALNRATDRSGTTMADRLDAETEAVEGLRATDDTGPLLRRALDRFDQSGADHDDGGSPETRASDVAE